MNISKKDFVNPISRYVWILSLLSLLFRWFMWDLMDILTPFIGGPLTLLFSVVFLISTVVILINALLKPKEYIRWINFSILTIMMLVQTFVPFLDLKLKTDFHLKYSKMEQVIDDLRNEVHFTPTSHNSRVLNLPEQYRGLSKGGNQIFVEQKEPLIVLFYTYRGIGNFAGYVYCETDSLSDYRAEIFQSEKYDDNWWWISGK